MTRPATYPGNATWQELGRTMSRLVRGALVAGAIGMLSAPIAGCAAASTQVKVLQLNICHSGVAPCYTGDRVLAKAESLITSAKPQILSVNESCANDVEPLRAALGPAEAKFVAAQRPDGSPVKCLNGQAYGNLIMVASALAGATGVSGRYTAQDGTDEDRVWACLPAGKITACTTHLSAGNGPVALAQCKELLGLAAGYAVSAPTVVSGDMNLRYPGSPDVQDCDPGGFYRKGDGDLQHVFATTNLTFAGSTKYDMAGTTDHPGLLVTMSLG